MSAPIHRERPPLIFAAHPRFELVLVRPEIAPNVGNVARSCAAFAVPVHLVGATAVDLSSARVRRAGVDTWSQVELHCHRDLAELQGLTGGRVVAFTTDASLELPDLVFERGDLLTLGPESSGLVESDLRGCELCRVRIPQGRDIRSLNLATCAGIACYAATVFWQKKK